MSISCSPVFEQAKLTRVLHLNSKHMTSLPDSVFNLTMITRLDLSDNNLAELPPEIQQMVNLESLWLNGNPLKSIPSELQVSDESEERLQKWWY
jgi:Leucine-rich repeat (LRR) protein